MAPPVKTAAHYEKEAKKVGDCLLHPSYGAARKVYQLRHGKLTSDVLVCHTCDTPACINDAHHFPGSRRDNILDAVIKGRHSCWSKGGARFTGSHAEATKQVIGKAAKSVWDSYTPEQRAERIRASAEAQRRYWKG